MHGKCSFEDMNVEVAKKFSDYLMTATMVRRPGQPMHINTKASYFSTFRAVLKRAYRDKLIKDNINDFLEKIEYKETKREYLTLEELKRLAYTPCDIPVLRRAAIFSCFTGLRVSDIMQLEWKHIVKAPDGGWCMRIRTEKTETEATLPISEEALSYCGKRKKDGKVFEDFARGMLTAPLKRWLERAGITKHITFHCFRHTFATLQLAMGTDLYTVSKMLTHRFISTTQIYADIMDLEKRKSANAISLK
jgi:integrase